MDDRSVIFLVVMAALAVLGVVAFLILLVARRGRAGAGSAAQWPEFLLAALALVVIVALSIWWFLAGARDGLAAGDWRLGAQAMVFMVVMLVVAGGGLAVFLIVTLTRLARERRAEAKPGARAVAAGAALAVEAGGAAAAAPAAVEAPTVARMLGLLGLAFAFLLLNWVYLEPAEEYALMARFFYPAALAVALVLLFDKATRVWGVKSAAEVVREWIICDFLVFLLILAFLNLLQATDGEKYAAQFWDFIAVVLFFLVFWLVDRRATRYRFLLAYGYLLVLPILLLLWRVFQEYAAPEEGSWWGTIWPFFVAAIVFFVAEVISLIATRGSDNHAVPALKDGVCLVIYGILLIVAIPAAA